ncbi:MAG: butyrate kinase [Kiritimatiellae bacterium]|nr:butyrate kinase [Kiritimatiellia bacterium]
MSVHRILVINTGSTSVKLALFENDRQTAEHTAPGAGTTRVRAEIADFLANEGAELHGLSAIAARGGLLRPLPGGTYRVNETMVAHLAEGTYGRHASNLSACIAFELAQEAGIPAFVVDPVTVDELIDEARLTGLPEIERRSIFHALSQRAAARKAATALGTAYEEARLIVAHMGGGVSVGAHRDGRVVDVNNAFDGDGPIAPTRAGSLPAGDLVRLCFAGRQTEDELLRKLTGEGGIAAHLGTSDMRELEARVQRSELEAVKALRAMAYTIAKQIGAMLPALDGRADGIVLTGALAGWERLLERIRERVAPIAPVLVYPENLEMAALAQGALRVLTGNAASLDY